MTGADFLVMLAKQEVPIRFFSEAYDGKYLFVSFDEREGDNVVEAHGSPDDIRGLFRLKPGRNGLYQLECPNMGKWVFVSNDKDDRDQIVEANRNPGDERNLFRFNNVGENRWILSSEKYGGVFLFVSGTTSEGDNLIEAHPDNSDPRDVFSLVVPDPERYTLHDANYSISGLPVPKEEPCSEEYKIDLDNDTSEKMTITRKISMTYTTEKTWSGTDLGIKRGVETTFRVGVPIIDHGKFNISRPDTLHGHWAETITEQKAIEQDVTVELPPHTRVVLHYQLHKRLLENITYSGTITIEYRCAKGPGAYDEGVSGMYSGDEHSLKVWLDAPKPIEVEPATVV